MMEEFGVLKVVALSHPTHAQPSSNRVSKVANPFQWSRLFTSILAEHMLDKAEHCHALAKIVGQ